MRVFGERGVWITADGDDLDIESRDRRQDADEFLGLAARAQGEDDITIGDHSQVAVQRVERIEHHRGRAGAGEGRCDLAADVPGFAHPDDDNFPSLIDRVFD